MLLTVLAVVGCSKTGETAPTEQAEPTEPKTPEAEVVAKKPKPSTGDEPRYSIQEQAQWLGLVAGEHEAVTAMHAWADAVCACEDMECVSRQSKAIEALAKRYGDVDLKDTDRKKAETAAQRASICVSKIASAPTPVAEPPPEPEPPPSVEPPPKVEPPPTEPAPPMSAGHLRFQGTWQFDVDGVPGTLTVTRDRLTMEVSGKRQHATYTLLTESGLTLTLRSTEDGRDQPRTYEIRFESRDRCVMTDIQLDLKLPLRRIP